MHLKRKRERNKSREINKKNNNCSGGRAAAAAALLIFLHHRATLRLTDRVSRCSMDSIPFFSLLPFHRTSIQCNAIVVILIGYCRHTTNHRNKPCRWLADTFIHTFIDWTSTNCTQFNLKPTISKRIDTWKCQIDSDWLLVNFDLLQFCLSSKKKVMWNPQRKETKRYFPITFLFGVYSIVET